MARGINPTRLATVIRKLQQERQNLQQRIDEIDSIFGECGITVTATAARGRPGRPPKMTGGGSQRGARRGRRRRRSFATSGTQSILGFVKQAGRGGATSSEISKHWKGEGRAGEVYITLGQLVKTGKLKKKSLKGERGSQYSLG